MTGVLDYGMGNVGSLVNMVERLGEIATLVNDSDSLNKITKLIFPGVGSFDNGVRNLKEKGFWDSLTHRILTEKIPVLCICLGMQLITRHSQEGQLDGLNWIDGECRRFSFDDNTLKVPHMGWNTINIRKDSKLTTYVPENPRFYFVHSYHITCNNPDDILATTHYGLDFVSMIQKGNIYATQFHPEKSHKYGMGLIKSFIEQC